MRAGAEQYLVLGALFQSPTFRLSKEQLNRHFRGYGLDPYIDNILRSLTTKGFIVYDELMGVYQITTAGLEARRAKRQTNQPPFLRLHRTIYTDEQRMR